MANPKGKQPDFDFIKARRNIIDGLGATLTLKQNQSGACVVLDRAAGTTVTLPAGANKGTFYEFMVSVTKSGGSDKVITAAATELLVGSILNCDTDTSDAVAIWKALVGSAYLSVNLNGSTKGGIKGDRFRLTKLNDTTWQVEGVTNGTGVVITPFATS